MNEGIRESLANFISPTVLWLVYLIAFAVFVVVSIALMYHWKNYNVNSAVGKRIVRGYFLVSGIFLFSMLVAAIAYSS